MRSCINFSFLVYFVVTGAEALTKQKTSGVAAKIQGSVIVPVLTPMDKDGNLNLTAISPYAKYLMANQISVILILGAFGEGPSLTLTEKKAVVKAWNKYNFTLIVNLGAAAGVELIEFAQFCEKAGVDAVMSSAPLYYIKQTAKDVVNALQNLTKTLGLIYEAIPMRTCVDVSGPAVFSEASKTMPNFLGMQCEIHVAEQTIATNVLNSSQVLIVVNYESIKSAYDMRFNATDTPITNLFPCLVNTINTNVLASQNSTCNNGQSCCASSQTAYDAQIQLENLVYSIYTFNGTTVMAGDKLSGRVLAIVKYAFQYLTGIIVGPPRFPVTDITAYEKSVIAQRLSNQGY